MPSVEASQTGMAGGPRGRAMAMVCFVHVTVGVITSPLVTTDHQGRLELFLSLRGNILVLQSKLHCALSPATIEIRSILLTPTWDLLSL